jgi:hypothetical protein
MEQSGMEESVMRVEEEASAHSSPRRNGNY